MKAMVCEMCQSNDIVKQDGMFVCQYCGCKYSVEEAKRMMIEGSVDVSGSTVKVDNSAFVQKYLENARRAKIKQDWEEVEKYYNMVEQNDPQNIEAIFYSSFGKVMQSLSDSNRHKRRQVFNTFKKLGTFVLFYCIIAGVKRWMGEAHGRKAHERRKHVRRHVEHQETRMCGKLSKRLFERDV